MKKLRVLDAWPGSDTKALFAGLCGISESRLDAIAQYDELPRGQGERFSALRARKWLADLGSIPNEIIVCVGPETIQAVGQEGQKQNSNFTFELGGGVHLGFYVARPRPGHFERRATKRGDRPILKRLLSDIVRICPVPVTRESAEVCVQIVREIGDDNISFWSRKVLTEIEKKLRLNEPVDKHDLAQLMQCYANDVQFLSKEN